MKKTFFNIVVLLIFSASIIIGCVPNKVQKDQSLETEKKEKISEPSKSYEDIKEELEALNKLLEDGSITKDEYYKTRARLLEEF